MKRITLVFGLVAVMAAMIVALAAPAMAKDKGDPNNGGINRLENRLDRLDDRLDFDGDIDVDFDRDIDFVNVDRDIGFSHGNNHNGSARHNGGGGHNKGHGK